MKKKILVFLGLLVLFLLIVILSSRPVLAQYECGYSLDYLARKYSGFGGVPWYSLVENGQVIGAADKTNITYSTTQGDWLPLNTYTDTDFFRLNVNGERNQGGKDPRTGYQVKYRVWGDTEVTVKTKTWGETHSGWGWSQQDYFQIRMNRIDTFQRQSETSILINGTPETINIGDSHEIQIMNWYPGDNGWAYSFLKINNLDSEYFEIYQEVWEYDEQYDSAHVRIESYIESVGVIICPPPVVAPTVVTNDATNVQETSTTLNGDITDIGGENVDERGFEWGTSLGGPYPDSWTESGSFGTGVFSHTIIGLDSETTYYFRAKANNSAGWGYGLEKSFTTASPPPPCENHNVWGWAWSENIGWISFSCRNTMAEGTGVDYGVDINTSTGLFSGYTWSENIGWISFEPADLVGCPGGGTCNASLSLTTGAISGWAKALGAADGWDGWIGLSGIWANGVSISSVPSPSEFEGWAWGDAVVGWISFNYKNCDTDSNGFIDVVCGGDNTTTAISDYKVMTSVVLNDPPYVEFLVFPYTPEYCNNSPTGQIGLEWTYQDDDGDQQAQYNLQVATDAGFGSIVIDVVVSQSVLPGSSGSAAVSVEQTPTNPLDIAYGGSYWWRISVKATTGNLSWSAWESGPSFNTPSNPYPNPNFDWSPSSPPAEVEVTFTDNSFCYTGFANCKDDTNAAYQWDFDYDGSFDPTDWTKGDTVYTYLVTGDYTVRLGVTDIIGGVPRTCYQENDLTATLPLPIWKEIVPF